MYTPRLWLNIYLKYSWQLKSIDLLATVVSQVSFFRDTLNNSDLFQWSALTYIEVFQNTQYSTRNPRLHQIRF